MDPALPDWLYELTEQARGQWTPGQLARQPIAFFFFFLAVEVVKERLRHKCQKGGTAVV